ncbi:MAG: hypothetical protein Q8P41_15485 [Pseudomonadota bacterium]|nr:hypothetical protein [Pseudomonadota bacterium]
MSDPRRVLVVANVTATSPTLQTQLQRLSAEAPTHFTLLVPASSGAGDRSLTWEENEVWHHAEANMNRAVERLRAAGLDVEGRVGAPDPVNAVNDLLLTEHFELLVVSTLPEHRSPWLGASLPDRLAEETGLDVLHVISQEERSTVSG